MTNPWGALFSTWKAIVPQNPFHCCPHQVAVILCEVFRSVALTSALPFMIIPWISVSWCVHPSQNRCSTTMSTCFSSFTLKSAVRHNFYSTPVKMELGAPPGGLLLPDSFSLPSHTRSTQNLSESFSCLHFTRTKTVHAKCLGSWNSHKYQWGNHIIFPMEISQPSVSCCWGLN